MTESTAALAPERDLLTGKIWLALFALYFIWGSTYLGIRIALESFPPLLLAGSRFFLAGATLLVWQRARGVAFPSPRQWAASALVGVLLVGGNTLVTLAELRVSSGLSAVAIGSVPLWVGLLAGLLGRWPARGEWVALAVGFCGVALLSLGGEFRGEPIGAALLLCSALIWSLGTILSHRVSMAPGLSGTGALMLCGGAIDLLLASFSGEHFAQAPSGRALLAFAWLVLLGSIVAYSAFTFLLSRVRPTLATSYAYVNPVVAVALGALLLHEPVSKVALFAMALILSGVALLARARSKTKV